MGRGSEKVDLPVLDLIEIRRRGPDANGLFNGDSGHQRNAIWKMPFAAQACVKMKVFHDLLNRGGFKPKPCRRGLQRAHLLHVLQR